MEEKGLPGSNSAWHLIRFGHWPSCSFLWWFNGRRWGTRCSLCVLYWSFLSRPQWRRLDTMCEMFQMGEHTLCWCWGRFCLWVCQGYTLFCSYFVSFVLVFFCFVTIPCVFCVNYSPPQIRCTHLPKLWKRVHIIWGDESFIGTNFTPVFLSMICDIYITTVSSLIKLSFTFALKGFTTFS